MIKFCFRDQLLAQHQQQQDDCESLLPVITGDDRDTVQPPISREVTFNDQRDQVLSQG